MRRRGLPGRLSPVPDPVRPVPLWVAVHLVRRVPVHPDPAAVPPAAAAPPVGAPAASAVAVLAADPAAAVVAVALAEAVSAADVGKGICLAIYCTVTTELHPNIPRPKADRHKKTYGFVPARLKLPEKISPYVSMGKFL